MGAFYFLVKVLACGHSATPSAAAGGVLGVVGGARQKQLSTVFAAAKPPKAMS